MSFIFFFLFDYLWILDNPISVNDSKTMIFLFRKIFRNKNKLFLDGMLQTTYALIHFSYHKKENFLQIAVFQRKTDARKVKVTSHRIHHYSFDEIRTFKSSDVTSISCKALDSTINHQ